MREKLKSRIAIATICPSWKRIARDYGVGVELDQYCQAENMDGSKGERIRPIMKQICEEFPVLAFHAPYNELFPAAIDPRARQLAMDRYLQAAELSRGLGVNRMVVHSGWVPNIYFKEWHIPRSIEFWTEFMDRQPEDFRLLIENVMDDEPDMMVKIAAGIDDPRVGLCYDAGHANIVSERGQEDWLRTMAPWLRHLHIHNNAGDRDLHQALTEGTLDIESLLDQVLEECREDTTVTVEILAGPESFDWLREKGFIE